MYFTSKNLYTHSLLRIIPLYSDFRLFFQGLVQYIHQLFKLIKCDQNTSFPYLRFPYSNQNVLQFVIKYFMKSTKMNNFSIFISPLLNTLDFITYKRFALLCSNAL